MEHLFVALYPLVAVISIMAYMPQVLALIRAKAPDNTISLQSWCLWIVSSSIVLGYGVFHLRDTMFIVTTALGLFLGLTPD